MSTDAPSLQWQVYGLRQCDSCRLARKWLEAYEVPYRFHDVRDDGLDADTLRGWLDSAQGSRLLNRRSTTWRQLTDDQKAACERDPLALLLQHPTLLNRPVITDGQAVLAVGYSPAVLEGLV